jgi:hypothetical protein
MSGRIMVLAWAFLLTGLGGWCARADCPPQWRPGDGIPGVDGRVLATAAYDDGRGPALYVGGMFTLAGEAPASNLARWDGQRWEAVGGGIPSVGVVKALAVFNGELIVAGSFVQAGSIDAANIAAWNGTSWHALNSGTDSVIQAAVAFGDGLVVGGYFSHAGGVPAAYAARWDGSTWQALGSGPGSPVLALTVFEGALVAAGDTGQAGYVARWDGTAWNPLDSFTPYGWVAALAVYDGSLHAAGRLWAPGGDEAVMRWNGASWEPVGPAMDHDTTCLTVYNNELIAGGLFAGFSDDTWAPHLARWNGTTWQPVSGGVSGYPFALGEFNNELIAGGELTHAADVEVMNVARWNGARWRPLTGGLGGSVRAFHEHNGTLIAGGLLTTAGGQEAGLLAGWNGQEWAPIGAELSADPNPYWWPAVFALETYGQDLVAAGRFDCAASTVVNNIVRWDGTAWYALGAGLTVEGWPQPGVVHALAQYQGELVAAGHFSASGSTSLANIAGWDGLAWQPLGDGLPGGEVLALATYQGELIAGGVWPDGIARWDGTAWRSPGGGVSGTVEALLVYGADLIVGGEFEQAGGVPAQDIARWDGANWQEFGYAGAGVLDLAIWNAELMAVSRSAPYLYRWTGTAWEAVPDALDGLAFALAAHGGDLFVGGQFTQAGGAPSAYWARRGCPYSHGDLNCDGIVDLADINPFVLALVSPTRYAADYPACGFLLADMNCDGSAWFEDVNLFVACVSSGNCGCP